MPCVSNYANSILLGTKQLEALVREGEIVLLWQGGIEWQKNQFVWLLPWTKKQIKIDMKVRRFPPNPLTALARSFNNKVKWYTALKYCNINRKNIVRKVPHLMKTRRITIHFKNTHKNHFQAQRNTSNHGICSELHLLEATHMFWTITTTH